MFSSKVRLSSQKGTCRNNVSQERTRSQGKTKTRKTAEKQATEGNRNIKEKDHQDHSKEREPAMTGHGETPEDTHETQPEILSHTRPPEENLTTGQDPPNKEKDHVQTENHQDNRQDPRGYAEGDVNKVFRKGTGPNSSNSGGDQDAEGNKSTREDKDRYMRST